MRLAGKLFVALAGVTAAAFVIPIGCGVDSNRYGGIGSEVPNLPYVDGGAVFTGSSGTGTSTGRSLNLCQCALTTLSLDGGACATCANNTLQSGGACEQLNAECGVDPTGGCQSALQSAAMCTTNLSPSLCILGAIKSSSIFEQLLDCECNNEACEPQCAVSDPIACGTGGGGAGGMGTGGGTGGSGTGGTGTGGAGGG